MSRIMQFRTTGLPSSVSGRIARQMGPRGEFFAFEAQVVRDPTAEGIDVQFGDDVANTSPEYWRDIRAGVLAGHASARQEGVRLCCTTLIIIRTRDNPVDTSPSAVRRCLAEFVQTRRGGWCKPITPLRDEWFTSDVVALARGIHATSALDGLPALTDALLEAGCDDPLAIEHLTTCPDHGPMCWVVEMICAQAAARDGTSG